MTPANPDDARYTLSDLADLAGVTPRTVRYYLAQGLLPTVGASGPGAKYDDTHLARLRLIRRLQREHQPLAEIRRRLDALDDASILALVDEVPEPPVDSALDYIRRVTGAAPTGAPAMPVPAASVGPAAASPPPMLARRLLSEAPGPYTPVPGAIQQLTMPARDFPTEVPTQARRSQWERIALGPDIELHIRRPLDRSTAKRVDRLIEIARDLLEEDPS